MRGDAAVIPHSRGASASGRLAHLVAVLVVAAPAAAGEPYDPAPWLADLEQARMAFATKYADLEWEVRVRKLDLNAVFAQTRARLRGARSDADARAAFDALARRFVDRHVHFSWPQAQADPAHGLSCTALGYNPQMQGAPLAALIPGFEPLIPSPSERFPAGVLRVGAHKVAVVKVPLFSPRGFPALCEAAIVALQLGPAQSCEAECADRIDAWASDRLTREWAATLEVLAASGADTLLVDIADNGGGSEWAEAAARMVSGVRLNSMPMYFVKGEHWARRLGLKEDALRAAAQDAPEADRRWLEGQADLVHERRRDAENPCDGSPLWKGARPECAWLGDGFYSTGLLQSADPEKLRSKPWAALVFSPMQYPYQPGVWQGPLVVLVNDGTGSAAEQFAAELHDNRAAIIVGTRTVGAGCGYTDGGTPTTLTHSRAVLRLPDCVRVRADGTNLAEGLQPDVPVALRADASRALNAQRVKASLGEAVRLAQRQHETMSSDAR